METRHLVTLLQAEAPVSLAGVQRFVEALLEEHVTPSTVGEIVLRVHGFLCHAETHLQQAAPQTIAALAATSDDHKCVRDALEKLPSSGAKSGATSATSREIEQLAGEVAELEKFAQVNSEALRKVAIGLELTQPRGLHVAASHPCLSPA